ncbi:MAG: NADH-quinone oxidoreductase subunit N [Actinobacteria bacterium]|nr:MAG: NADH-quinone oxidoreductase subunit N [Actinomycetota bacterium]
MLAQTAFSLSSVNVHAVLPEIIITAALIIVLVVDLFLPDRAKSANAVISMAGVGGAAVALMSLIGTGTHRTFGGMFVLDGYAMLFKFLFLAVAAILIFMSVTYLNEVVRNIQGEFYFLLLTALLGMLVMPSARDLIALFIALETVTVPGFIIAGFKKHDNSSNEAAVKFFLFGVLSSAVMLFGMALIYGVTKSTNLYEIARVLSTKQYPMPIHHADSVVFASILLIIVGFGFKVSAVPFHFWAPDTYEGSPVPVAAFLSVASKAAGFAGLMQITFVAFGSHSSVWAPGFAILAALTMTVGNVIALQQKNIVRLLAYSSIAQAGYILIPLAVVANKSAAIQKEAFAAALTYILISMLFFLLSLAGMIPTAGFWAKFFVFRSAIGAGTLWLAAVMVANTLVGLYYYLSVGAKMYLREPKERGPIAVPYALVAAIVLMVIIVAAVTVYPDFFNHFSPRSTLVAF